MGKAKHALTKQLSAVLETHLRVDTTHELPPKAIAKVLRKLAKRVLAQATPPSAQEQPTPKQQQKALAEQMRVALQSYLPQTDITPSAAAKEIKKQLKKLAAQAFKQRQLNSSAQAPLTDDVAHNVPKVASKTANARTGTRGRPTTKKQAPK